MWNQSGFGNTFGGDPKTPSGGFLNTTTGGTAGSQEKRKSDKATNVVPCTIGQIMQVPENEEYLTFGSMTARMVTFVGIVRSIEMQTTRVSFTIDDATAPSIEVQVWLSENEATDSKVCNVKENTYVRVTGALRSMKGKRHVIGFNVTPIADANEITMHIIETIHAAASFARMQGVTSFSSTAVGQQRGTADTVCGAYGLSIAQKSVLNAIASCTEMQGVSIYDLYNMTPSLDRNNIKDIIEFLSNEGHIYTTIDDDHFKSTEM